MATSKQYDNLQTRNKYCTFIGLSGHNSDIVIQVNDKFKRANVGIPNGSGTEISDFAITAGGLTSFIKLSRFNVSADHVEVVWGGTDDQIITATGTGHNSVYGNNGEPPIGDLPAGFTGCCRVRTNTSEGFVFLEFTAAN
jgi:Ca2+-binding RTX toxin-like protein